MVIEAENKFDINTYVVKLSSIEDKIKRLQFLRNEENRLMKSSIKLRNEYNKKVSEYLKRAKEFEEKRNSLNSEVQKLKDKRAKFQEELIEKKNMLDNLIKDESSLVNKKSFNKQNYRIQKINKEIQKIEWKLQTSILKPEEERELIQMAEKLSENLNSLTSTIKLSKQQNTLWKEVSKLRKEINHLHNAIIELAKESQMYHKAMNESYAKVNEARKKANSYHKEFIQHKKQGDSYHRELLSLYPEKNRIKEKLGKIKRVMREKQRQETMRNLEENVKEALNKYKNGVNLSLDEFRLLVERGLI